MLISSDLLIHPCLSHCPGLAVLGTDLHITHVSPQVDSSYTQMLCQMSQSDTQLGHHTLKSTICKAYRQDGAFVKIEALASLHYTRLRKTALLLSLPSLLQSLLMLLLY